jgi:hypothetical protein
MDMDRLTRHEHRTPAWVRELIDSEYIPGSTADAFIGQSGSSRYAEFPVTPGKLDEQAVEALTNGYCWMLAIELHRATRWPIALASGQLCMTEHVTRELVIEQWDHALVQEPDGWLHDAAGTYLPEELGPMLGMGSSHPAPIALNVPASILLADARSFNAVDPAVRRHNWSLARTFARAWLADLYAIPGSCPVCELPAGDEWDGSYSLSVHAHADDCPHGPDFDFAANAQFPALLSWSSRAASIPA